MDDARERDVRARRRARRVTKRAERRAGVRTDRDARERSGRWVWTPREHPTREARAKNENRVRQTREGRRVRRWRRKRRDEEDDGCGGCGKRVRVVTRWVARSRGGRRRRGGGARRETGRSRLLLLGHPECVLETFEGEIALDFSAEFANFRGLGVVGIDGERLQGRLDRLGGSLERRARGKVAGI